MNRSTNQRQHQHQQQAAGYANQRLRITRTKGISEYLPQAYFHTKNRRASDINHENTRQKIM
jgi:hypothetical protein